MTLQAQHTILQHCFDLTLKADQADSSLLSEVDTLFKTSILSSMESLFNEFCPGDLVFRVDKIYLDLGTLNQASLQTDFPKIYIQKLRQFLEHNAYENYFHQFVLNTGARNEILALKNQTLADRFEKDYLYFLNTGHWPDQVPYVLKGEEYDRQLLNYLENRPGFAERVLAMIRKNESVATRFVWQATPAMEAVIWKHFENSLSVSSQAIWKLIVNLSEDIQSVGVALPKAKRKPDRLMSFQIKLLFEFLKYPEKLEHPQSVAALLIRISKYEGWSIEDIVTHIRLRAKVHGIKISIVQKTFWSRLFAALQSGSNFGQDATNNSVQNDINIIATNQVEAPEFMHQIKKVIRYDQDATNNSVQDDINIIATNQIEAPEFMHQIKKVIRDDQFALIPVNDQWASVNNVSGDQLAGAKLQLQPDTNNIGNAQGEENTDEKSIIDDSTTWYADSAGLVILHPFLPAFFQELGLLDGPVMRDPESIVRAVHLLYYLAEGKEQPTETELLLPKLLCGLPLGQPIPRFIELTVVEKTEAYSLLKSVVSHWEVLKNTSPEALRETFLQRFGKLIRRDDYWRLIVETKTIDILLQQMPWSVSTIKLPWMPDLLFVDWC